MHKERLLNLQLLRAFAALLVVYVHAEDVLYRIDGYALHAIGNGGVDLFFVISGFVMVLTTAGGKMTAREFLWRRFVRVAPLYWLITLAVFSLAVLFPALFKSTQANTVDLLKSLLFVPYLKGSGLVQPVVFVGWTLNLEMAFYAVLALMLFLSARGAYAMTITSLLVCSLVGLMRPENPILRFYTTTMLGEFGLGMALAVAWSKLPASAPRYGVMVALFMIAGGASALIISPSVGDRPVRFVVAGIPSMSLVCGAVALDRWGFGWRSRIGQLLGDASYSIYLTHFFVTDAAMLIARKMNLVNAGAFAVFAACVAALIVVGIVTHLRVERPLTAAAALLMQKRRVVAPAAPSAMGNPTELAPVRSSSVRK